MDKITVRCWGGSSKDGKDGILLNLRNKEGIWRLCQDGVSSLGYAQWSASGKGIHRQNLVSAGAKNRRGWGGGVGGGHNMTGPQRSKKC